MKRMKWLGIASLGLAGLLVATPTLAKSTGQASTSKLTGEVENVDFTKKQITLEQSTDKLQLTRSTKILRDGKPGKLSDVRPGDEVSATYTEPGNPLQVSRLEVSSTFNDPGFNPDRDVGRGGPDQDFAPITGTQR